MKKDKDVEQQSLPVGFHQQPLRNQSATISYHERILKIKIKSERKYIIIIMLNEQTWINLKSSRRLYIMTNGISLRHWGLA